MIACLGGVYLIMIPGLMPVYLLLRSSSIRSIALVGVILLALGWAFYVEGALTLAYAVLTVVFFDIKTRREENWLMRRFPEYAAYRQRVRKLIPFVY